MIESLLAAAICAACMAVLQLGFGTLAGNDSYYHVRMAEMLPQIGYPRTFPWLHWTIFRDDFVSHHYGFHTLLAPFVRTGQALGLSGIVAAQLFAIVCMGLTGVALVRVLRLRGVEHRLWWVLLLTCVPWHFWLRMSYIRAPLIALPLLLLAIELCLRQRPILLAALAFVFTHIYGGAVLFPLIPGGFVVAAVLLGEPLRGRLVALLGSLVGVGVAFVANPYFPANVRFYYTQLFETGLGQAADIGNEWRPLESWFLFVMCIPLAVVFLLSLIRRLRSGRRADVGEIALLLIQCAFLVLTLKARRFVEYWPAFALLSAADLGRWDFSRAAGAVSLARPISDQRPEAVWPASPPPARWWTATLRIALPMAIFTIGLVHLIGTRRATTRPDHAEIERVAAFLKQSTPEGSLVLTDDWDSFPMLFYYDTHNYYAVGLDPVFTKRRWPVLWERYRHITRGEAPMRIDTDVTGGKTEKAQLSDIREHFGARYVLVADDHQKLYRQLSGHRGFRRIYPPADPAGEKRQPPQAVFEVLSAEEEASFPPHPATRPASRPGKTIEDLRNDESN